jgi:hypothetical protein
MEKKEDLLMQHSKEKSTMFQAVNFGQMALMGIVTKLAMT